MTREELQANWQKKRHRFYLAIFGETMLGCMFLYGGREEPFLFAVAVFCFAISAFAQYTAINADKSLLN